MAILRPWIDELAGPPGTVEIPCSLRDHLEPVCAVSCSVDRRSLWLGTGRGRSTVASLLVWAVCAGMIVGAKMPLRQGRVWPLALMAGLLFLGVGRVVLRHLRVERWYFCGVVVFAGGGSAAVALGLLPGPGAGLVAFAITAAWSLVAFGTESSRQTAGPVLIRIGSLAATVNLAAVALAAAPFRWDILGFMGVILAGCFLVSSWWRGRVGVVAADAPTAGSRRGLGAALGQGISETLRFVVRCARRCLQTTLAPLALGVAGGVAAGQFALRLHDLLDGSTPESAPSDVWWLALWGLAAAAATAALVRVISRLGSSWSALADLLIRVAGSFAVLLLLAFSMSAIADKEHRVGPVFWGIAFLVANGLALGFVWSRFRRRALLLKQGWAEPRVTPGAAVLLPRGGRAWPGVMMASLVALVFLLPALTTPAGDLWRQGVAGVHAARERLVQAFASGRKTPPSEGRARQAVLAGLRPEAPSSGHRAGDIPPGPPAPGMQAAMPPPKQASAPVEPTAAVPATPPVSVTRTTEPPAQPSPRPQEVPAPPVVSEEPEGPTSSPRDETAGTRSSPHGEAAPSPVLPSNPAPNPPPAPAPVLVPAPEPTPPALAPPAKEPVQEPPAVLTPPEKEPIGQQPPVLAPRRAPAGRHPRMGQVFTFSVPAGARWVDTGLELAPGQVIALSASGDVFSRSAAGARSGPGGQLSLLCQAPGCSLEGARYGALVARVEGRRPFFVGLARKLEIFSGGRLYLSVNDDPSSAGGNSGGYRVEVRMIR